MKKIYILPLLFTFLLPVKLFSKDENDTLRLDRSFIESKLARDFDSLLMSFYVQQALQDTSFNATPDTTLLGTYEPDTTDVTITFADSLIMRKMSELQVLFDVAYNPIVKAYIKVYTERKRELTQIILGLSKYYFPIFESELDAAGMPLELKYLAVIESALNPRAVSRAGATGLWQFMYSTGRLMGLEINTFVDQRRDVTASTKAAIKFLKQLYSIYNDWSLALAAYNCGPGNVNKAIRRSNGRTNYWEIYYRLPRETRNYVPGFIAVMYVMENYQDFGLVPVPVELPVATDTIIINQRLHLEQVSAVLNLPINQLRDLNPQYRRDIIPASPTKPLSLRLPLDYSGKFIDLQDSIFRYKDSVYFNPVALSAAPVRLNSKGGAVGNNYRELYYTVVSGDNLGYIAKWFNVSIADLREWNGIYKNNIRAGQRLLIYVPKSKYAYYQEFNQLSFEEKQARVGITVSSSSKISTNNSTTSEGKYLLYTVRKGDTLWEIARRYDGVTQHDLLRLNNLPSEKALRPGVQLKIKKLD
ncbi:MAG TPA: transglycosylase SLT domain-containing protein [Salinivirgaceae bacterium]|nr:transglycosylase SLT domain-containing protein [Salinivirgaceae bacterium]